MDSRRLACVRAGTETNSRSSGSGYLVSRQLVLTSAHVVAMDGEIPWPRIGVSVGHPETMPPVDYTAKVVWFSSETDVTLLRLDEEIDENRLPVRWGRFSGSESLAYKGLAFPAFAEYASGQGIEPLHGSLNPLGVGVEGYYILDQAAAPENSKNSLWGGASGAAVFCDDLLIGVVAKDDRTFGNRRLQAIPIHRVLDDPDFIHLIAEDVKSIPVVESVELKPLFNSPQNTSTPATPGSMLSAAAEVVDFNGREDALDTLTAWRDSESPLSMLLVRSEGGQGKTRLAREFLRRSWSAKWVGGFLKYFSFERGDQYEQGRELSRYLPHLRSSSLPTLIVIDYAETRPEDVGLIADELANESPRSRVRLLLLSRNAGDWWENISEEFSPHAARVVSLAAWTADKRSARESAYSKSVACFARHLPSLPEPIGGGVDDHAWNLYADQLIKSPPELAGPRFGNALTLQIAALVDLISLANGEDQPSLGSGEDQTLIRHERDYLFRVASRHGLLNANVLSTRNNPDARRREARAALERALAGLILLGSSDQRRAHTIGVLASEDVAVDVADWLVTLYPPLPESDSYIGDVQPDRLAELLLGGIIERQPETLEQITELITEFDDAQAVLFMLVRTAAHPAHVTVKGYISDLIVRSPGLFAAPALVLGSSSVYRNPLYEGLIKLGQTNIDAFELHALAPARWLPSQSTRLAFFSAAMTEFAADLLRRLAATVSDAYLPNLSIALNDLSNRQAEIGRDIDALQAAQEAVVIRRKLVERSAEEFEPFLAGSLNNLAIRLRELGHRSDAVAAARESLLLARKIYEQNDTDINLAKLAMVYNTLATVLDETTSAQEIISSIEESVALFRRLVKKDRKSHLPDLASSLLTLAASLYKQEKFQAAVSASREAVKYFRVLAREDSDAYLPGLATSLSNLAHGLDKAGRKATALSLMKETVATRTRLAENSPIFLADLGDSLLTLTAMLGDAGRLPDTLSTARKAVKCHRALVQKDSAVYEPILAHALDNLAFTLSVSDQHAEAVPVAREAVQIRRTLSSDGDPSKTELANSISILAHILVHVWSERPTIATAEEVVDLFRECLDIDSNEYRSALVGSLTNLALTQFENAQFNRAREVAIEALEVSRDLNDLTGRADLPDLAVALSTLSKSLSAAKEFALAGDVAGEAVRYFRAIADVSDDVHQAAFAESLLTYAISMAVARRADKAIPAFDEAAERLRRLVDRGQRSHLPALVVALNDLTGLLSERGASDEAISKGRDAVKYAQILPDGEPARAHLLPRAFVTYGHALIKGQQHIESIQFLWRAMEISADLASEHKREIQGKAAKNIRAAYEGRPADVAAEFEIHSGTRYLDFMRSPESEY